MIYTTTESIPGKDIEEILGVVVGNVVQSKHIGRDIMASLKLLIGGEIRGYTEMLTDARDLAISRLVEQAKQKKCRCSRWHPIYYKLYNARLIRSHGIWNRRKIKK